MFHRLYICLDSRTMIDNLFTVSSEPLIPDCMAYSFNMTRDTFEFIYNLTKIKSLKLLPLTNIWFLIAYIRIHARSTLLITKVRNFHAKDKHGRILMEAYRCRWCMHHACSIDAHIFNARSTYIQSTSIWFNLINPCATLIN